MLDTTSKAEDWAKLKSEFHIGQIIEGKVLAHWPFGVFVDLGKPFLGLIEIVNFKERGEKMQPREYPELGASIKCKILQFADGNFQLKLSARPSDLRQAEAQTSKQ